MLNILMVLLVIIVLCLWLIIVATIKFVDITVTASLVGLACAVLLILAFFILYALCSKSSNSTGRSEEQDVENSRIYTIGSSSNYPTESPPPYDIVIADDIIRRLQELGFF